MKKLILLAALVSFSVPVLAATAQQTKMSTCNADAKTKALKGAERKKFMSECLSAAAPGDAAPAAAAEQKKLTPQQEKMKSCNADAKTKALKGAERKTFMSTCLKS